MICNPALRVSRACWQIQVATPVKHAFRYQRPNTVIELSDDRMFIACIANCKIGRVVPVACRLDNSTLHTRALTKSITGISSTDFRGLKQ